MSTLQSLGYMIGEMQEDHDLTKRGYTNKTNDCLAGDNASPMPGADIAAVGFEQPQPTRTIAPAEGVSFREAMADQGDAETKLALYRR